MTTSMTMRVLRLLVTIIAVKVTAGVVVAQGHIHVYRCVIFDKALERNDTLFIALDFLENMVGLEFCEN